MKSIVLLAVCAMALFTGCGDVGDTTPKPAAPAKIKPPYTIEFAPAAAKPGPAGVAIPAINYAAISKTLERRASLIVRLDATGPNKPARDQMIMGPVDIPDPQGTLPANYMNQANDGLSKLLTAACMKGPVKIKVVLVRSSIKPDAGDGEIDAKRLSEWLPGEVVFKNPHPKC